ncbi:hypothetical protein Bbelb_069070 [Branchiostoma belcheri]|nr:hypothetical protein Bbelb_069070 [Branchiostoma belcheri]
MSQYPGSSNVRDTSTEATNVNMTVLWDDGEDGSSYGPMTRLIVLVTVLSVVIIGGMLLVSFNLFLRLAASFPDLCGGVDFGGSADFYTSYELGVLPQRESCATEGVAPGRVGILMQRFEEYLTSNSHERSLRRRLPDWGTEPYGLRHISGNDEHNERYSTAMSYTGDTLLYGRSDMMDFSELP